MFEPLGTQDGDNAAADPEALSTEGPVGFAVLDPAVDPVGFLTAAAEALAKLPSNLWRTGNDGFASIAAGMDALGLADEQHAHFEGGVRV